MKGATTEPCAIISKPPSINITMIIGMSHNFLRTRRKVQSSFINSKFTSPIKSCLVKFVHSNNLIIKPYGVINPKKIISSTIGLVIMARRNTKGHHQ